MLHGVHLLTIAVPATLDAALAWVAALDIRHDVRADSRHFTPWGGAQPRSITHICLHSTQSAGPHTSSLAWLTTAAASIPPGSAGPSAHTLAGRDSTLWELVSPADIAHHVGWALPGYSNKTALGLEIENSSSVKLGRHEPYPAGQLSAVAWRLATWAYSYSLGVYRIVAHRDIAVWPPQEPQAGKLGRRTDPDNLGLDVVRPAVAAWLALFRAAPPDVLTQLIR